MNPLFPPKSKWVMPNLASLPSWADAKRVCVDVETRDPQLKKLGIGVRRGGEIVGYGFAIEDGPSFYLPVAHGSGENLSNEKVVRYLKDQAKIFTGEIVGANLPYDLDYMAEEGIIFRKASFFRDVQVAEPLLDELHFSYSLDNIAGRWGIPGKDETLLKDAAEAWGVNPKSGLWELPAKFVGPYGEQDCRLPLTILRRQEREIEAQGLRDVYDLESMLLPVLVKMRRRGVRVDFDKLDQIEEWAKGKEVSAISRISHLTKFSLTTSDTTKNSSLIPVLESIGLVMPMTEPTKRFPNGQKSCKNGWLEKLPNHPVIDAILEAKKFNKLQNTFVKSIRTHAIGDRIHCTFKQIVGEDSEGQAEGAKFGRLSCKQPNLQQQPARDPEIGPMWRQIYIPDEGGEMAVHDFSQQEPRWLVHFAEILGLPKAKEMGDKYRSDPKTDNHDMVATLINPNWPNLPAKEKKKERMDGKTINLGLGYGMGGKKLALSLGRPTAMRSFTNRQGELVEYEGAGEEAQDLLDRFEEGVPFIKALMKLAEKKANKAGFVRTISGRRCRFPEKHKRSYGEGKWDLTHKAGSRVIQGSAGDQTKEAMVQADAAGIRMQLQVHDELTHTIWSPQEALECAEIMMNAVKCNVPHRVDIETGPNWGQIKEPEWAK